MYRLHLSFTLLAFVAGCGTYHDASTSVPASKEAIAADYGYAGNESTGNLTMATVAPADEVTDMAQVADNRKIIYTASLSIVVDDFGSVEQAVTDLVKQYGGFIASANVSLNQGSERSGMWVVRIPVATFESFLDATGDMGVPERRQQNGQDVTEEYVDLEARIRSKQKLEERILELLADNKGEIKDVIDVERELSRVRTEIEQMEGRLRYLTDRTELTTVTLNVREEQDYTPPQAPGLGTQIATAWTGSTGAIGNVAKNLLLVVVACAPWLLIVGIVIGPLWAWRRKGH